METPWGNWQQAAGSWVWAGGVLKGEGLAHAVSTRHSHLSKQVPTQVGESRVSEVGNGLPLCCYCVAAQQSCRIQTDSARGRQRWRGQRRRHTVSRCRRGMEMRFRTSSWARNAHFQNGERRSIWAAPWGKILVKLHWNTLKIFILIFLTLNLSIPCVILVRVSLRTHFPSLNNQTSNPIHQRSNLNSETVGNAGCRRG